MKILLKAMAGLLVVAVLATQAAAVAATTSVTYSVSGFETYASSTHGIFTGSAWMSDDLGTWYASVYHSAFDSTGNAAITGGTFSLNGYRRDASGTFASGSVRLRAADPGCGRQWYDVNGSLTLIGGGSAQMMATLTHYRYSVFGFCLTYSATVSGHVELDLP
jgi:hypothetical protein